jgi:hypothetical protein
LLILIEIKRDSRKVKNIKRARLLKKCNIEKEKNLNQLIDKLKQKASAKTQPLSRYKKRQNRITKINCLGQTVRNFITVLDRHTAMRKMHQTKSKWRIFGRKFMRKKFKIMNQHAG